MQLTVNGATHELEIAGHESLLSVLRERLHLTGAKLSCGRGECGACTVLVSTGGRPRHTVYSCVALAAAYHDAVVTTIEGLSRDGLHPLQEAFIRHDAVQCGFCTPGQILAAAALLDTSADPGEEEIRAALSGNLCRCGTYPRIVRAIREAAERIANAG